MSETIGPATNYRIVSVVYCTTGTKKWIPAPPKLGCLVAIYVPITQDGKVVDSQGFLFDAEDE
jgi:hypothetical protein